MVSITKSEGLLLGFLGALWFFGLIVYTLDLFIYVPLVYTFFILCILFAPLVVSFVLSKHGYWFGFLGGIAPIALIIGLIFYLITTKGSEAPTPLIIIALLLIAAFIIPLIGRGIWKFFGNHKTSSYLKVSA